MKRQRHRQGWVPKDPPSLAWRRRTGYAGLGEVMRVSWREKRKLGGGCPPPNYPAGVMERMASDQHDDTTECLGGLALGTLVGHFSVLRNRAQRNGSHNISSDSSVRGERCPWPQ